MNTDFYRRESTPSMKNGARSKTRVIAKANRWRLITVFISIPFLGNESKNTSGILALNRANP